MQLSAEQKFVLSYLLASLEEEHFQQKEPLLQTLSSEELALAVVLMGSRYSENLLLKNMPLNQLEAWQYDLDEVEIFLRADPASRALQKKKKTLQAHIQKKSRSLNTLKKNL